MFFEKEEEEEGRVFKVRRAQLKFEKFNSRMVEKIFWKQFFSFLWIFILIFLYLLLFLIVVFDNSARHERLNIKIPGRSLCLFTFFFTVKIVEQWLFPFTNYKLREKVTFFCVLPNPSKRASHISVSTGNSVVNHSRSPFPHLMDWNMVIDW